MVELFLFASGIGVDLYEADYGVFRQEIIDPDSQLYRRKPSAVFIATNWRDAGNLPGLSASNDTVTKQAAAEFGVGARFHPGVDQRLIHVVDP